MLIPGDDLEATIRAAHRLDDPILRGAIGHSMALETNHRALCCSLMMTLQSLDQGWMSIVYHPSAEGEMARYGMEQLRGILADVNPCPDFLDDPTPEAIAAMKAEPGYAEQKARILARGMEIFAEVRK